MPKQPKCPSHPDQPITNICLCPSCMSTLCPVCICEHTQAHNSRGCPPVYQNIKDTLAQTKQGIEHLRTQMGELRPRIKKVMEGLQASRKNIGDVLSRARMETVKFVERLYREMEQEMSQKLSLATQQTSCLNQKQLNELYLDVSDRSLKLYTQAQHLDLTNSFDTLKQLLADTIPQAQTFLHQTVCQAQLRFCPEQMSELGIVVRNIVQMSLCYPVGLTPKQNIEKQNGAKATMKDNMKNLMSQSCHKRSNSLKRPMMQGLVLGEAVLKGGFR